MGTRGATRLGLVLAISIFLPAMAAADEWLAVTSDTSSPVGVTVEASRTDEAVLRLDTPGIRARDVRGDDARDYVQLSIPGCGAAAERYGYPELPFKGLFVEFPAGTKPVVEIVDMTTVDLGGGYAVYPWQLPVPESDRNRPPFVRDEAAYGLDAFVPAGPVTLDTPGVIRGRHVVFVQVWPVQYNAATGTLRAIESLRLKVRFEGTPNLAAIMDKQRLATRSSEALAASLIVNYEPAEVAQTRGADGLSTGPAADYLIIVGDQYEDEILPLAQWKHKKGYITRVALMSEVGASSSNVKNFIQTAYNDWDPAPSFVLLAGDIGDVPSSTGLGLSCTSDHGYACVDGSDHYPDLTLSRLSFANEAGCEDVVAKMLTYDRTPDAGGWYHNFLAAAEYEDNGNDGWSDRWFMETAMTAYDYLVNEQGWGGYTALCPNYWPMVHQYYHFRQSSYPHREQLNTVRWGVGYPDPIPQWITDRWTDSNTAGHDVSVGFNAGVGIVQHRDHGSPSGWSAPPFKTADVYQLTNGVMTPVVFSLNCSTGSFQESECFCEALLRKYPGGGIGAVGATRTSYSGYNDLLAHGIYSCMFPDYDTTHSGNMYGYSRRPAEALNFGKYYMAMYEGPGNVTTGECYMFHYFGDPEMNLRTMAPRNMTVMSMQIVPYMTPMDVLVKVTIDWQAVPGALVAITHPTGEDYWRGWTDGSGVVVFEQITFHEMGDYDLVVTALDARPVERTIAVGNLLPGDMDCDGEVNFGDINPFVRALTNPAQWQQMYPDCSLLNGDINEDGKLDFADINPFARLMIP